MRPRILLTILLTGLFVILSGCGSAKNCPVCGTTTNGAYAVINTIPVPEHNAAGEPGGPFNSFDISWIATPPPGGNSGSHNLDYISDRIGLDVAVIDTNLNIAVNAIQGTNSVADGVGLHAGTEHQVAGQGAGQWAAAQGRRHHLQLQTHPNERPQVHQ